MIKILAIGNSFSQDATAQIEPLCGEIFVRNLYIGGCSLETHTENARSGAAVYEYQKNGEAFGEPVSLSYALSAENWDWVTVQQASGLSGIEESYEPFLTELLDFVRSKTGAKLAFHRTWAYEPDSTHPDFPRYKNDTSYMWQCIQSATEKICNKHNLPIIDSGAMISALRKYDFFNKERGGIGLCRDGFHLSCEYGRIAAACVWIKFFTGKIPNALHDKNRPEGYEYILNELSKTRGN